MKQYLQQGDKNAAQIMQSDQSNENAIIEQKEQSVGGVLISIKVCE